MRTNKSLTNVKIDVYITLLKDVGELRRERKCKLKISFPNYSLSFSWLKIRTHNIYYFYVHTQAS